jgi:hypothetical protein
MEDVASIAIYLKKRGQEMVGPSLRFTTVTFTTVGYGDKSPITSLGKIFSMMWMFVGLGRAVRVEPGLTLG